MLQIDPTRHYPTYLVIVKDFFDYVQVKESNKYFTNEKNARNYAQNSTRFLRAGTYSKGQVHVLG